MCDEQYSQMAAGDFNERIDDFVAPQMTVFFYLKNTSTEDQKL